MTHPTTEAVAEIKRALASTNSTTSTPSPDGIDYSIMWVPLRSGRYINGVLYQRVKQQLLQVVPFIPVAMPIPVNKIFSCEFWDSLSSAEKRSVGKCVADLVARKAVDLVEITLPGVSPKVYCRM
jgi:hypothetical protein